MNESTWFAMAILAALIGIVALIIIASRRNSQKMRRQFEDLMNKTAASGNFAVERSVYFSDRAVGVDLKAQRLVYVIKREAALHATVADLTEMTSCEVRSIGSATRSPSNRGAKTTDEHINEISLVVRNRTGELVNLVFYNDMIDGIGAFLDNRRLATEWHTFLTDHTSTKTG